MGKNDFCVAYGCNHHRGYGATCNFFTFPQDKEYFDLWVHACKRELVRKDGKKLRWTPSAYQKLCSCHFLEGDCPDPKSRSADNKRKVPTIFSHQPIKRRRPVIKWLSRSQEDDTVDEESCHRCCSQATNTLTEAPAINPGSPYAIKDTEATVVENKQVHLNGHDYLDTIQEKRPECFDDPDFQHHIEYLRETSATYESMVSKDQIFNFELIHCNPKLFEFYTGLDVKVFDSLFTYFEKKGSRLQYFHGKRTSTVKQFNLDGLRLKPGASRQLSLQEEFFSVLYRLHCGHSVSECALRMGISDSQFSRNFTTWINFISLELEMLCKNAEPDEPTRLANCFKPFSNLRVILDCTELFSETPSSVENHRQIHSQYKHHSTVKFLVGINPSGAVTYISKAYGGRASDKLITQESEDLLSCLDPGQKVMVDRGFTIEEDLPCGVSLIIPSFKGADRHQIPKGELVKSKIISRARVHVERCMRRIKTFNILRQELKLSQVDVYEQIFKTCAYLVNFQNPFLKPESN